MFCYPNCKKLPIGKIDDNTVYLDFELDEHFPAYLIRLYCATNEGCQFISSLVDLFLLERFKGNPTFILNQYFIDCFDSLKGVNKYLTFDFELFLNGGVPQKKLK